MLPLRTIPLWHRRGDTHLLGDRSLAGLSFVTGLFDRFLLGVESMLAEGLLVMMVPGAIVGLVVDGDG